jgi:hypothetical protein
MALLLLLLLLLPDPTSTMLAVHLPLLKHTTAAALLDQQSSQSTAQHLDGSRSAQLQVAVVGCCLVVAAQLYAAALRSGRTLLRRRLCLLPAGAAHFCCPSGNQ